MTGIYGEYLSCDEIYNELIKDKIFFDQVDKTSEHGVQRGGVTFSGGEPLLQFDVLAPLLKKLKKRDIHICVETSLFISEDKLSIALKYVDLFYVDVKILDGDKCQKILGGNLKQYIANLDFLFAAQKSVVLRVPIIGRFTDDSENINLIGNLIKKYKPIKIEIIKEHNLGKNKYQSLGKKALELHSVSDKEMEQIKDEISNMLGIVVEICKI